MRRFYKSNKVRVPRKLKKASKGIIRQIRTVYSTTQAPYKYQCDEWVNFAIIGRDTKYKHRFIKLSIKEMEKARKEMIKEHFKNHIEDAKELAEEFKNKGFGIL